MTPHDNTDRVTVQRADLWTLLLSFIRYALPRHSYVVAEASDFVGSYAPHLYPWQRAQMAREIREAVRINGERQCEPLAWLVIAGRLETP